MKRGLPHKNEHSENQPFKKLRGVSARATANVLMASGSSSSSVGQLRWSASKGKKPFLDMQQFIQLPLSKPQGTYHCWPVLSLTKLVSYYVDQCPKYGQALLEAIRASSGCLDLVLYEDEIIPNNVLKVKRKMHVWYATFKQLSLLNRYESFWLPFAALFSKTAQKVDGGVSCATKLMIESMLNEVPSLLGGVAINHVEPVLLKASLGPILQDEVAMKFLWSVKGHAGIRPCIHCSNVLMKDHPLWRSDALFCDITEDDVSKFQTASDVDIWADQDFLAAQKDLVLKGTFENFEKCCGQNLEPQGLLASHALRRVVRPSDSLWDPMHTYFSDGICGQEIDLLLKKLRGIGVTHEMVMQFTNSGWLTCQSSYKVKLDFKKDALRGGASECMTAMPLLSFFLTRVLPADKLPNETASFHALHNVVVCLAALKARPLGCLPLSSIDDLTRLQRQHLLCFKAAYDSTEMRPKHHYSLHIPSQLKKNQFVLDCFTPERKHRLLLAELSAAFILSPNVPNRDETHLLATVNIIQVQELNETKFGLLDPITTTTMFGVAGVVLTSSNVRLKFGLVLEKKHVFFKDSTAWFIKLCVLMPTGLHVLAERFRFSRIYGKAQVWLPEGTEVLLPVEACFAVQEYALSYMTHMLCNCFFVCLLQDWKWVDFPLTWSWSVIEDCLVTIS